MSAGRTLDFLPFIGEKDVARVLTWPALIEALERVMIAFSSGRIAQPVREIIPVPGQDGFIAAMPAAGAVNCSTVP